MNYAEPIVRPLRILWQHKYLLLLALFGGGDVTSGGGFNYNSFNSYFSGAGSGGSSSGTPAAGNLQSLDPNVAAALAVTFFLIIAALLLLLILFFFLSCLTQGAMTRAVAEHDADRHFNLSSSLRAGLASFGWILLLRLLGFVAGLVLLLPFAALIWAFIGFRDQPALVVVLVVTGLAYLGLFFLIAFALGLIQILALRAIVLEQRTVLAAIGRAVRLLLLRPGRVLLTWLIQVGLAFGVGLALAAVVLIIAFGSGLVGFAVANLLQVSPLLAVALGGTALGLVSLLIGAVTGAYFSAYWTVAYRRLELDRPRSGVMPYAVPQ
ncbi:MAG: hypothetical protein M3Y62_08670 [Candidatus Dormibacteraeota bacterium]|nr:hypothetical protein [Candidatus Dormibacteraeota bacterium]